MRPWEVTRARPSSLAGFTLVEILLALLILSVGLLGVLALFPLGIDAARVSVETTQAANIARMVKAYLFVVTGPVSNRKTPFERIVEDVEQHGATGPWFLPYDDEVLDPDYEARLGLPANSVSDGPEVEVVVDPGENRIAAEYAWSVTVARPASDMDVPFSPDTRSWYSTASYHEATGNGLADDYSLGSLQDNENVFVVQVTVYRKFGVTRTTGDLVRDSMVIENVTPSGVLDSVRSGDYVRNLDISTTPWSGDGFWYQVDQVDGANDRVKVTERFWGLAGTDVALEFTERVIGTYTFLLSAN